MHLVGFLAKEKFDACIHSWKRPALIVECVNLDEVRPFIEIRNGDIYPPTTARVRTWMLHKLCLSKARGDTLPTMSPLEGSRGVHDGLPQLIATQI
jgi:hypothetical protein